jgi:hypothetical protein
MNANEPVAWLVQYQNRHEFRWSKPEHLYEALACIPLYTHPLDESTNQISSLIKLTEQYKSMMAHPNEHDLGVAEAIGFDKGHQAATARSQEPDSYGDGTVYRGVRSKDSQVKTYVFDEHAGKQTWSNPAKTPTDDFIYRNHMGYVSPGGDFYAPDYPTWKQDGFTPVYREPVAKTLTDEEFDRIFADGKRLGVLETEDRFRKAMNPTDEEILKIADAGEWHKDEFAINFARAVLRKAQEK